VDAGVGHRGAAGVGPPRLMLMMMRMMMMMMMMVTYVTLV
jgi:hypothetical protein